MKNIRIFETESEYKSFKEGENAILPHVCLTQEPKNVWVDSKNTLELINITLEWDYWDCKYCGAWCIGGGYNTISIMAEPNMTWRQWYEKYGKNICTLNESTNRGFYFHSECGFDIDGLDVLIEEDSAFKSSEKLKTIQFTIDGYGSFWAIEGMKWWEYCVSELNFIKLGTCGATYDNVGILKSYDGHCSIYDMIVDSDYINQEIIENEIYYTTEYKDGICQSGELIP